MPEQLLAPDANVDDAYLEVPPLDGGEFDAMPFAQLLASGTEDQRRHAIFLLLRSLLGNRADREAGVYDREGFLYAYIMPVGQRERLRFLEDPGLLERLEKAAREEERFPMREVMEELRLLDEARELGSVQP